MKKTMDIKQQIAYLSTESNLPVDKIELMMDNEIKSLSGLIGNDDAIAIIAKKLCITLKNDNTSIKKEAIIEKGTDGHFLIWDDIEEKKNELKPFVKWTSGVVIIRLIQPISKYEPVIISGSFGDGNYIEIEVGIEENVFEVQMLKIDSVRLRKAIVTLDIPSYPAIIEVLRLGSGFATNYKAKLLELVEKPTKQTKFATK